MENEDTTLAGGTRIESLGLPDGSEELLKSLWIDSAESFQSLPEDWRNLFAGGDGPAALLEAGDDGDDEGDGSLDRSFLDPGVPPESATVPGLPPAVRLMDGFFPVRSQFSRGSCSAFATTALCEYAIDRRVPLSEQFLYWATQEVSERSLEELSEGASMEAVQRALDQYGICPAADWTYSSDPSAWSVSADPRFDHQGDARIAALSDAAQYRVRGCRTIPQGAVSQFKHALFRGLPVVVGVPCFQSWSSENEWASRTGQIALPLVCPLRVPYPFGTLERLSEQIRAQTDPEGDLPPRETVEKVALGMLAPLLEKLVPGGSRPVVKELGSSFAFVVAAERPSGGHALCLAGYADDPSVPGGGYFIARNSWGADWASESPERAGYAMIPYAYVKMCQVSGFTFFEKPPVPPYSLDPANAVLPSYAVPPGPAAPDGPGAPPPAGASRVAAAAPAVRTAAAPSVCPPRPPSAPSASGFAAWLSARTVALDRPTEVGGMLMRPGTRVLLPDPSRPEGFLRDTPANRERLRAQYEGEAAAAAAKALADRFFGLGQGSPCAAAFAAARGHAGSFLAAERARIEAALPGVEETDDLSSAWVAEKLSSLHLPGGAVPPEAWVEAAAAANRAQLFHAPGEEDVWIVAASLRSFAPAPGGAGLVPAPASADDVNLLHGLVEALHPSGSGRPRVFYFLLSSDAAWAPDAKGRLLGSATPVLLASSLPDGSWTVELPPPGRVPAERAAVLDALVPVPEEELLAAVREAADGFFSAMTFCVAPAALREDVVRRRPALAFLGSARVRSLLLALQASDPGRYALCVNPFGSEELRPASALAGCRRVTA